MNGSARLALALLTLTAPLAACGNAKHAAPSTTTTPTASVAPTTTVAPTTSQRPKAAPPGALQGEALSAAAGDIPDNQVFVLYSGPTFAMKVPEGWARRASGTQTTFRDKNNIARVVVQPGAAPTVAALAQALRLDKAAHVTKPPHSITLGGVRAVAATYTTTSAPSPVTGKRVTLTVDRYQVGKGGRLATVDLGTPVGVDNVDAYRLMIESLRLR